MGRAVRIKVAVLGLVFACAGALAQPEPEELAPVLHHYAVIVHAVYADTLQEARSLHIALRRLVDAPSPTTLAAARHAWLEARSRYALSEAFRFYGGPIDGDGGPEPRLNTWPVDESYIDGLIAQRGLVIDRTLLVGANLRGGEENVATGWHAIEYLLWGADTDPDGPGDRPYTDYVDAQRADADRRRHYLLEAGALLVDDLTGLEAAWKPAEVNYRAAFERGGADALRSLVIGLGSLSRAELAGERLEVPLASRDQEDEQSCFSDSTHRDIVGDAQGIANVWAGHYVTLAGEHLDGPALRDLIATRDPALAARLSQQIADSLQAAQAIEPPFDREILGGSDAPGRLRIRRVIDALVRQSASLVEAARTLGLRKLNWVRKP